MASEGNFLEFKQAGGEIVRGLEKPFLDIQSQKKTAFELVSRGPQAGQTDRDFGQHVFKQISSPVRSHNAGVRQVPNGKKAVADVLRIRSHYEMDFGKGSVRPQGGVGGSSGPANAIDVDLATLGTFKFTNFKATGQGRITDIETYEDTNTHKMGGYVRGTNRSAGNRDYLIADAESGFWWWHTPSKDCRLNFNILAIQTYARQYRELADEGIFFHPEISNAYVRQTNYITAGLFVGDTDQTYGRSAVDIGPGSIYRGDGDHSNDSFGGPYQVFDASGIADLDELVRNGTRTIQASYSPTALVRANQPVCCFIGAQASFYANLDDVKATIRQGSTCQLLRLSVSEV